ncbi:hypothetical protein PUN28_016507 [Cardiocondyla obscurior]|uniref:C2H2-type domain-containing protein n=1 Tax=Cardiocondyla obscurior TaxID=286306 RepID=A0AAW2EME8_9HYME
MGQIKEENHSKVVFDKNDHISGIQTEKNIKQYKCKYSNCQVTCSKPSKLERHIRSHTGEKPYKCTHFGCIKSYTNSSHLKRHFETHNLIKKVYKCPECSKSISNLHNLKRHCKKLHSQEKKICCKECNITFNKKYQLVQHQTTHSIKPITYKCDKCSKSFSTNRTLQRHQIIHEKIYFCTEPGCTKVFDKWTLLRTHRKVNHVRQYKCESCAKVFLNKSRFKLHSKTHLENRQVLPCSYDNCNRVYYFKSNLTEHIRTKHLGKKFYCDICSMGFTTKQKLIKHIQHHYESKKKKERAQQKKRKDVGIPKKSVISALIGVNLPHHLEKMILKRETVIKDITEVVKSDASL